FSFSFSFSFLFLLRPRFPPHAVNAFCRGHASARLPAFENRVFPARCSGLTEMVSDTSLFANPRVAIMLRTAPRAAIMLYTAQRGAHRARDYVAQAAAQKAGAHRASIMLYTAQSEGAPRRDYVAQAAAQKAGAQRALRKSTP